jgi:hypothetical protein
MRRSGRGVTARVWGFGDVAQQRAQVASAVEHRQPEDLIRLDPMDDPPWPLDELAVLEDTHGQTMGS